MRPKTGEQNQHGWFTPRRYKALGQFLEACRNVHPGSLPLKPELKKDITQRLEEDAHWNYYNFRNSHSQAQMQSQMESQTVTESEISQLPAHFRE